MKALARQPARFTLKKRSAILGTVTWRVTVSEVGIVAVRDFDRRRVAITWERLIGAAMFFGHDGTAPNGSPAGRRNSDES